MSTPNMMSVASMLNPETSIPAPTSVPQGQTAAFLAVVLSSPISPPPLLLTALPNNQAPAIASVDNQPSPVTSSLSPPEIEIAYIKREMSLDAILNPEAPRPAPSPAKPAVDHSCSFSGDLRLHPVTDLTVHESWALKSGLRILNMLGLKRNVFHKVFVVGKKAQPTLHNAKKPSVASIAYIIIAKAGAMKTEAITRTMTAYFCIQEGAIKSQTIRKALCNSDAFRLTVDGGWRLANEWEPAQIKKNKGYTRKRKNEDDANDNDSDDDNGDPPAKKRMLLSEGSARNGALISDYMEQEGALEEWVIF